MGYKKLSDLYVNFEYMESDIQLEKGALLLNDSTSEIIAQLRFCNYSSSKLKSLYIAVEKYDDTGAVLDEGERTQFAYLDLSISKNQTFGDNVAVVLDNVLTRNIKVYLIKYKRDEEVINVENSEIYDYGEDMSQIKMLANEHAELFDKYYPDIKTSYTKVCYPLDLGNIWFCSCGKFNHNSDICVCCGLNKNEQIEILTRKNAYMLSDREKQKTEEIRKSADIRSKKQKKIWFVVTLVIVIVVTIVGVVIAINNNGNIEVDNEPTTAVITKSSTTEAYKETLEIMNCNYSYNSKNYDYVIESEIKNNGDYTLYDIVVEFIVYDTSGKELPINIEYTIDKINPNKTYTLRKELTYYNTFGDKLTAKIKTYKYDPPVK